MKPVSIKGYRKKEIRKLRKEQRDLYAKSRALGYRKLEKPIRHGWYIELTILPQIERYRFKPQIEEILKKLEKRYWELTKEQAKKKWDSAESKHLIYKDIPTLSPKSYRKLRDKAQGHCRVFFFKEDKKLKRRYYVRIPKNAFKISFKRAYTTHSKIIDPLIEERLDLIQQQFEKKGWFGAAKTGHNYWKRWGVGPIKKKRKQAKRELKKHRYTSIDRIKKQYEWERN